MSDSSDDDDGLLSGGPAFKRRTRKSVAKEKKMFNFLDDILEKEQKLRDRQVRMDDMMKKGEEREQVDEEKENIESPTNSNEESTKDESLPKKRNIDDCEKDESEGPSEEGDSDNNVISVTATPKRKKYDIIDPSYWSRVDAVKKDVEDNLHERDRRWRIIEDEVEGIQDTFGTSHQHLHSDDEAGSQSSENGDNNPSRRRYDKNEDRVNHSKNVEAIKRERERRNAQANAAIIGQSTNLGTRQMFFTPKDLQTRHVIPRSPSSPNSNGIVASNLTTFPFPSKETAMDELNEILQEWDKRPPHDFDEDNQQKWKNMRNQIIKNMQKAIKVGLLPEYLEKKELTSNAMIPHVLLCWMIRMALSVGDDLSSCAHRMAVKVIKLRIPLIVLTKKGNHLFHIRDFVPMLRREFGLWTKPGTFSVSEPYRNEDNSMQEQQSLAQVGKETNLKYAFEIWACAMDNNLVALDDYDENRSMDDYDGCIGTMAYSLAMLVRCGLDPSFYSGKSLLEARNSLILSFFNFAEERIATGLIEEENTSLSGPLLKWIYHAADLAMKYCENLSSGVLGSSDADDTDGWLPIALAVRTCQHIIEYQKKAPITFFAILSSRGVQKCFRTELQDWDNRVLTSALRLYLHDDGNNSPSGDQKQKMPLAFQFLATAEVVLSGLLESRDEIKTNGPCFLTVVDLAALCAQMGILLFQSSTFIHEKQQRCSITFKTKSEADAICKHFSHLEDLCTKLKKEVICVFSNPHFRRVKELLSYLGMFYRCFGESANMSYENHGKDSKRSKREGSLLGWVLEKSEKDDENSLDDTTTVSLSE